MGNRTVHIGGNANGSTIVLGDDNTITTRQVQLPAPEQVDMVVTVGALRQLLGSLGAEDQLFIDNALAEAEHEVHKAEPRTEVVAKALDRALETSSKTKDFVELIEKVAPHVLAACGWLGQHGLPLLAHVGLQLAG